MKPIGLTFKAAGDGKTGEIMVVHKCVKCGVVRKNRIAGDDKEEIILEIFKKSVEKAVSKEVEAALLSEDIHLLGKTDEREVLTQLFGKPNLPQI